MAICKHIIYKLSVHINMSPNPLRAPGPLKRSIWTLCLAIQCSGTLGPVCLVSQSGTRCCHPDVTSSTDSKWPYHANKSSHLKLDWEIQISTGVGVTGKEDRSNKPLCAIRVGVFPLEDE